jgi:NAD(P)H dehydrogenase (quinone)
MILITGGSGQLSTLVAQRASKKGLKFLVGSRQAADGDAGRRRIDFDDPHSLDFSGVQTLFMVSAGYEEDDVVIARHGAVIAAAEHQGVRHIVYTSLTGAGDHLGFALAHRWTERRLQHSSFSWTILRNGLYAELIGTLAAPVNGVISAPFGSGRISSVARDDLADAAMTVLSDPAAHANLIYELVGTQAWSIYQLAERLGVEYSPETQSEARDRLSTPPLLPFQPAMLMSIYSASAAGFLQDNNTDLLRLIEDDPRDTLQLAAATALAASRQS